MEEKNRAMEGPLEEEVYFHQQYQIGKPVELRNKGEVGVLSDTKVSHNDINYKI